jgi:Predicted nucleic-acid-binding protein containing a Zn-ribbon
MANAERVLTLYDLPMWEAVERGKMALQKCAACSAFRYPPGPACPQCLSLDHVWEEISGRGRILSWVVFHRQYFDDFPPAIQRHRREAGGRADRRLQPGRRRARGELDKPPR